MPIKPEGKEEEISERDSIVDSIVEENEEDQKQYEGDVEPDQEEEILEEKKEPEDDKSESEYQIEQEKLLEKKEPEEEMVEIVVYGEKKMVPLSEIKAAGIRDMQKESAADERLSDAKELLKEVKALKSQPEEEEVKGMTPKEIAYAIQYGTEDEAAEAIKQIGASQNNAQPGVTTEDIQKMVNTTVEDSNNSRNIFDKFNMPKDKGGFLDITEDPNLMDMAVSNVNKRLKKGETNSWETYEKAGNDVRGWLAKFQPEKSDFSDKKDKKKTIDNIPAASAVQDLKKPKDKGQTATEVIEEMGAGRPGR